MSKDIQIAYLEALDKIADLEAKLALYEKDDFEDLYYKSIEQRKNLETKLSEKEKELEQVKNLKAKDVGEALSCVVEKLTDVIGQKLDTATILDFVQIHNQDKISFCIEQLEKVKNAFNLINPKLDKVETIKEYIYYIDNQIKQLKGGK